MPQHNFARPGGRLVELTIDSEALKGNLLGDPHTRTVVVYLPEGYDASDADYPLFVDLVGFTGSGLAHVGWRPFGQNLPQRLDRLVAEGRMGPVVLALPDCFTTLGGNQYIDSEAMGHWAAFLTDEMLPRLEAEFRLRPGRQHRAVFGKSSGGYGALVHGMKYAEHWGAIACHSGDIDFELTYRRDFPRVLGVLAKHRGDVGEFLGHVENCPKLREEDFHALMILAMSATYAPDPTAPKGARLPVDPATCEIDPVRWSSWLEHDPLVILDQAPYQQNLRRLSGLYLDCGVRDQYYLHFGARSLVRKLEALGIPHRYHEFDDNHSNIDYRMDVSLPFLYEAIAGLRGSA